MQGGLALLVDGVNVGFEFEDQVKDQRLCGPRACEGESSEPTVCNRVVDWKLRQDPVDLFEVAFLNRIPKEQGVAFHCLLTLAGFLILRLYH